MRLVRVYLVLYALLVLGALYALRTGGVLQQLPSTWVLLALAVAVFFGALLALTSRRPPAPQQD